MKKLLVVALAVAVAFAFAVKVYAADTNPAAPGAVKVQEKVKVEGNVVKVEEKAKAPGEKEKIKATENLATGEVKGTDVTKMKKGEVWKDTVKFQKFEANGDYIYVMKDNKVIRLKHTLSDNVKKDMLSKKAGDTITITSTYPLTNQDLAVITDAK